MRIVVALGGNALLRRDEPQTMEAQRDNIEHAAGALAELAAAHELVVTHGNGPQVGLLALQAAAYDAVAAPPLDVLGAESEGMIGYMLEQALESSLPGRAVATLLTQVVVAADDPAFDTPTKPIGPVYDAVTADRLAADRGWRVAADADGYRRVVASPEPLRILEMNTIRLLVEAGVLVICAGGGGIPVTVCAGGVVRGVEAVVDKDSTAALLAMELAADALLILTDVDAVYTGWSTEDARALRRVGSSHLATHDFAPGSMAPKVNAACRFVEAGGGFAGIGTLNAATAILNGDAGTTITAGAGAPEWYPA